MEKKVRIQPQVEKEVADKLQIEANSESRKLATHAAHILKEHAKELPKPFMPKKEYGKE